MTVKYQQGGGVSPYVYYKPVTVTLPSGTTATSSTTTTNSNSYEISNKDLLKALDKIDGLPSDMAALKDNLISALNSGSNLFGDSNSLFSSTGLMATQYANTLLGIKIANFSKKSYDNIKKELDTNGGLNEVAVTDTGQVVVADKDGNIKPVSVEEYLANKGKYRTFTNSNLLYMRAYNSDYANNDSLMNIANAGIGLSEINKQIKAAFSHLGTTTQSKDSYEVLQGAEKIKEIYEKTGETKLEGLYKISLKSTDSKRQISEALNYAWGILGDNAKAVLMVKAGGEQGAKEMIANIIASGTSDSSEYKENYILDKDGAKPGSKKSGSGGDILDKAKQGAASNFINGNGKQEQFTIVNGTKDGIVVSGTSSPLTTNTGKIGGPMSMLTASKGGFGGVLDWNNMSIGGKHVSEAHMAELMCTDGTIHSVDFPSTTDEQGNIVPDYKLFQQKEAADQEINRLGIDATTDPDKANEVYRKHGLPLKYNSDGSLNSTHWTRFGVMNGVALSKAFDEDQSFNSLLKEVGDNDLEGYLKLYNNEAKISGAQQEAGKDIEFDKASWWDKLVGGGQHWYSSHDQMFKGTIFIPIRNDQLAAMYGDANKTTVAQNLEITGRQQDEDIESEYNDPGDLE